MPLLRAARRAGIHLRRRVASARPSAGAGDREWCEYLFYRTNAKGEQAERWCHSFGCGQWFNVLRNTVTHEILETYRHAAAAAG